MLDLIEEGHTPLVVAQPNSVTGVVELQYTKSEPTTPYVAISHL